MTEGISVILHHAEASASLGDKLPPFAFGVIGFAIPPQTGFAVVHLFSAVSPAAPRAIR